MDSQIQPIVDVTLGKFDPEFRILDMVTYPNPFTENVNFKFYLHRAEEVTIKISDILGREITTYKSNLGEGVHQIPINITSSEESGKVFVYRLYTGNELRTTGKLVSF
jgi:2-phosphoglycerate kinase